MIYGLDRSGALGKLIQNQMRGFLQRFLGDVINDIGGDSG